MTWSGLICSQGNSVVLTTRAQSLPVSSMCTILHNSRKQNTIHVSNLLPALMVKTTRGKSNLERQPITVSVSHKSRSSFYLRTNILLLFPHGAPRVSAITGLWTLLWTLDWTMDVTGLWTRCWTMFL